MTTWFLPGGFAGRKATAQQRLDADQAQHAEAGGGAGHLLGNRRAGQLAVIPVQAGHVLKGLGLLAPVFEIPAEPWLRKPVHFGPDDHQLVGDWGKAKAPGRVA